MSQFSKLDALIVARITQATKCDIPALALGLLFEGEVRRECHRLAKATGSEEFRIMDGRLQALRKKKLIAFVSCTVARGWTLHALL